MQRQEKNLDEEIQIILSNKEEEEFDIKLSNGQISLMKKVEEVDPRYSNEQDDNERRALQRSFEHINSFGNYSDELLATKSQALKLGDERVLDKMSYVNDFYKIQKEDSNYYEMDIDSLIANSKPFLDFNDNKNDSVYEKTKNEASDANEKEILNLEEVLGIGFKEKNNSKKQVQYTESDYDHNSYRFEPNKSLEYPYSDVQKPRNELLYRNSIKHDEKLAEKWANPDFLNINRPLDDTLYGGIQSERAILDRLEPAYIDGGPQVIYDDYGSKYCNNNPASDTFSSSYSSINYTGQNSFRNQRLSNPGLKSLYYNKIFQQQNPSYSPENLLFRNPLNYSDQFKSQVYYKIKKRRRLNSNTWNTSENSSIVHPSRLSSLEFLHGRQNPASSALPDSSYSSISFILNSNGEMTAENLKIIENFKKITENLDFNNVTVFQLKQLMKDFGLNHAGKKNDLINRIKTSLQEIASLLKNKGPLKDSPGCEKEIKKEDAVYDKFFF